MTLTHQSCLKRTWTSKIRSSLLTGTKKMAREAEKSEKESKDVHKLH